MPINKFNSSIFNGEKELSFLHLKNSFEIDLSKNNIIFAFNGTCKTTISNYLVKKYGYQFFLINYEDNKDAIKAVKTGKKIELLIINLKTLKYNCKLEESYRIGQDKFPKQK